MAIFNSSVQYFNWFEVFVNEIAGSAWMFLLIMVAVIFGVGSWLRMPWKASLMISVTFFIMFSAYTGGYYLFVLLGVAVLLAIAFRKIYQSITS